MSFVEYVIMSQFYKSEARADGIRSADIRYKREKICG